MTTAKQRLPVGKNVNAGLEVKGTDFSFFLLFFFPKLQFDPGSANFQIPRPGAGLKGYDKGEITLH